MTFNFLKSFKMRSHKFKQTSKKASKQTIIKPRPSKKRMAKEAKDNMKRHEEQELNTAKEEFKKTKSKYLGKVKMISNCIIKRLSSPNLKITDIQIVANLHKMKDLTAQFDKNLVNISELHAYDNNPNYASLPDNQLEALMKAYISNLVESLGFVYGQNIYDYKGAKKEIQYDINVLNKKLPQELFSNKIKSIKDTKSKWADILHNLRPDSVYILPDDINSPKQAKHLHAQSIISLIKKFNKRIKSSMHDLYKVTMMG